MVAIAEQHSREEGSSLTFSCWDDDFVVILVESDFEAAGQSGPQLVLFLLIVEVIIIEIRQ